MLPVQSAVGVKVVVRGPARGMMVVRPQEVAMARRTSVGGVIRGFDVDVVDSFRWLKTRCSWLVIGSWLPSDTLGSNAGRKNGGAAKADQMERWHHCRLLETVPAINHGSSGR